MAVSIIIRGFKQSQLYKSFIEEGCMVTRRGRKALLSAGVALLLLPVYIFALQDGGARTPPMGFSTWNYFGCGGINETNVMAVAASLVKTWPTNWEGKQISLQSVGYKFINLDDCWPATPGRTASGTPIVNTSRFPHGFYWLTDTLHKLGLKAGIYSCCGTATCAGYIGSYGYESIDALQYVQWGFDYLKEDWCNVPGQYTNGAGSATLYSRMGHALDHADSTVYADSANASALIKLHKMTFSLCQWGDYNVWTWGDTCGHLWRISGDINASWGSIYSNWSTTMGISQYAGPGGWNDPDMLEIGNGGLSNTINQSHMDMWCIAAAPLLMGNNTPAMSNDVFTILSNREVIAVDQDSLGYQGRIVRTSGSVQVIVKKLKVRNPDTTDNKKYAVVILNSGGGATFGDIKWSDIGQTNTKNLFRVRNLWLHGWLKNNNINDTANASITGGTDVDTNVTVTDSVYAPSIPSDGTVHVLMEMGNPDDISVSVRPQDNAAIAAQLGGRMSIRGNEIFIPLARSMVQVFDMQGRQIASISASQPGWYAVTGRGAVHGGTYLVRLNTPAGSVSRVMAFVK